MSILGKENSIGLEGNGNVIVQDSNGTTIYSLNINDKEDIENEQLIIKQNFNIVTSAKNLSVANILDIRANSYQKFYHERSTDDEIFNALIADQSVLIIGNSLSGKTRAVYEVLKKEEFKDYLVIIPEIVNDFIDFPKFENINLFANSEKKKIIFLDDIHLFFQKENANYFIHNILRNGITIIATCMTGPEFDIFLESVESKVDEQFELIEIPKIQKDIIEHFDTLNLKIEKDRFDGNIGSLFLSLNVMKKRYQKLVKSKQDGTVKLALTILEILKALYFSANFEQKSAYSTDKMKDFYFRKIDKKSIKSFTSQMQQQIYEKILKEDYENITRNWEDAVDLLRSTYTDLNFIEKHGNLIRIEEVYFEKGIFAGNYSSQDITHDIFQLYTSIEERQKFGFYVKTRQFSILISKARNYKEAFSIYKKMQQEKIKPDEVTFNTLINKAPDFETGKAFLEEMAKKGINPDEVTFNSLINKAPDFETGKAFLVEMTNKGINPDEVTYTSLINKAPDFETAKAFLEEMANKGINPDKITFNSLINKAPDFETGKIFLVEMVNKGISPNEVTFNSLINKMPDFETGKAFLVEMANKGINPDEVTFNSLINKAPDFETGKAFLEEMATKGIKPDEITFNSLINKAPDFETGKAFLEEMASKGIKPNEVTFTSLINKAPDFETGKAFLEEMATKGIKPDEVTFNSLINKAPDFETGKAFLEEMAIKGIKPDEVTFNSLINKAPDFETGKAFLVEMENKSISPDEVTFNSLINKAPDFETGKAFLVEMVNKGISPNEITFNNLINKTSDFETAKAFLVEMENKGINPNEVTFNTLINKAPDFETGKAFLVKMVNKGISPNKVTYTNLINKAPDFETGKAFLEEMANKGISPDEVTFNSLINKTPDFETAKAFLVEMENKGISPDEVTFTSLINKAPDFETGKAFLVEMATKGIKPNEVTFNSLIKLTKSDPQSAINHFFENYQYNFLEHFDNKFITSFFEYFDYIAFIQKYFSTIINTNDNIIFLYAIALEKQHTEKDRDLALSLLKNIKDENSDYYNILANLYRNISTEKSIELYAEAAKLETHKKNKAKYYHSIASLIYEQNLVDKFKTAIEYCNKALECNTNFDYSKKLLTFLTAICIQESLFIGEINILIKRFGYNKKTMLKKIINELENHNKMENRIELLINEKRAINLIDAVPQ
ncbi:MAG: hypothetical protein GQ564_04880 [Bacteroidales bacterium]|nr:hypothetical protein [Bacteroidales bacterium]